MTPELVVYWYYRKVSQGQQSRQLVANFAYFSMKQRKRAGSTLSLIKRGLYKSGEGQQAENL